MHSSHNTHFESLEELLLELQEEPAQLPHYAEEDDAVTRLLQVPLEEPEWIVVVAAHDRRMLSTSELAVGLRSGELRPETLVWRSGMRAWSPIAAIAELNQLAELTEVEAAPLRREPPSPPPITYAPVKVVVPALEIAHEPHVDVTPSTRVKQVVMGLSALSMVCVFLTMFAISSAREGTDRRARSRGVEPRAPAAQAPLDETSFAGSPEDLPATAAALPSEADSNDITVPPSQQKAIRRPDTRERY